MSSNLIEAAKAYRECSDARMPEHPSAYEEMLALDLGHKLDEAIAKAEQQAADDAIPLDDDWIATEFRHMGPQYSAYQHRDLPQLVWLSRFERLTLWDNPLPHIKTRGQLRRLVKLLKGGES